MSIESYLNEVQTIINLLRAGKRNEADYHIEQANDILRDISPNEPFYDNCLIVNTMIRDYWNGIPAIDIEDIEDERKSVLDAVQRSKEHKHKESGM
jgi:hypothetical protein